MSFSYDLSSDTPGTSHLRLIIDDKNVNSFIFDDEELRYYLLRANNNVTSAAIEICKTLAFKYMNESAEEITVDDIKIKETQNKAKQYLALAERLSQDLLNGFSSDGELTSYWGGVYQADIDSNQAAQDNGTIVKNNFSKEMFDTF